MLKKRIVSLLLSLMMVLTLLPSTVFASGSSLMTLDELRKENGAITIEAYNIGQGFLVEPSLFAKEGKSVGDITVDFLESKGLTYSGDTSYFSGMEFDDTVAPEYPEYLEPYLGELYESGDGDGVLAEFDYSMYAGWCFTINDWWASWGASDAYPSQEITDYNTGENVVLGDVIRWHYTVYGYGADCGFPSNVMAEYMGGNLFTQEDKSDLIFALAAIKDYYGNLDNDDVYETALAVAADPLAEAVEISEQEAILEEYIEDAFFVSSVDPDVAAANEVEGKIAAIGTVTSNSKDAIEAARVAYDALSDAQKTLVENYDVLIAAEDALATINKDKETANVVVEKINAIGTVTIHSAKKIADARSAYNALTEAQKAYVENYEILTDAEAAIVLLYAEAANADHKAIYEATGKYISNLGTPTVGSTGGEWMIIDLVRDGYDCPEGYYENVVKYVQENINDKEQLHRSKGTDNSRVILALTAAGYDVTDVAGHNLLMGLTDMTYVKKQGINGPIWALIAFDTHVYEIPINKDAAEQVTREGLITYILEKQLEDGGWALSGQKADPDMTGMAIQSLAPYYEKDVKVKEAVDKALLVLSEIQLPNGGYGSIDGACSESCAQVIVALTALGINPETDARFIKNGVSVLDAMCLFAVEGGGFEHVPNGSLNGMATEQAQYALVSYFRFLDGKTSLYDMNDVTIRVNKLEDKIENTTKPEDNAFAGDFTIEKEEASDKLLTEEEKALVESGEKLTVNMTVEDITDKISVEEKTLVEEKRGEHKVGLVMDITITKQIGNSSAVKVTETNGAVEISIEVPVELRNTDTSVVRTYKMMRIHEGKVDILDVEYDKETGKLVFETDAFSTYVLIYSDAPVGVTAPVTGDNSIAWFYIVLAACGMVLVINNKKIFVEK